MAKIIGTGETVTDFIIRKGKPEEMVCGGSCYNSIISIGRCGISAVFIGEVGDDKLGLRTKAMLRENNVDDTFLTITPGKKSQLSLAFLNERNDAEYAFYKDHAADIFPTKLPTVSNGDVLLYGSYYALNPTIHDALSRYLDQAKAADGIIYYDINFRASHLAERELIMPSLIDNLGKATIVRGSHEDFLNLFDTDDTAQIYDKVSTYCPNLIITRGGTAINLLTPSLRKDYAVQPTHVVSTVGAGDNFNAGIVCSIIANKIGKADIATLTEPQWDELIATATTFAQEVCGTTDNYISQATGQRFKSRLLRTIS